MGRRESSLPIVRENEILKLCLITEGGVITHILSYPELGTMRWLTPLVLNLLGYFVFLIVIYSVIYFVIYYVLQFAFTPCISMLLLP